MCRNPGQAARPRVVVFFLVWSLFLLNSLVFFVLVSFLFKSLPFKKVFFILGSFPFKTGLGPGNKTQKGLKFGRGLTERG